MISFIRIDDRMIHGQTVTRWSLEYPCDGLIAVNDAAASNPVLKEAYKSFAIIFLFRTYPGTILVSKRSNAVRCTDGREETACGIW